MGDTGVRGLAGEQGPAGLSWGTSIAGASTGAVTACATVDLAAAVIIVSRKSRIMIAGRARLSANGATGERLTTDVLTNSPLTLGTVDTGAPFPVDTDLPEQHTFNDVVMMSCRPVDVPPGIYNVRFRLEQTVRRDTCSPTLAGGGAGMTALLIGTTP